MKILTLIPALLIFAVITHAQIVNIPNAYFKSALINDTTINTNQDNEIQISEAIACDSINVPGQNISNLKGIEAFTNLNYLNCSFNPLITLDLSNNTILKYLNCKASHNNLTTLDVSKCTVLKYLDCSNNALTTLDVSNNTTLTYLDCAYNGLSVLNLNNNLSLTYLSCDHATLNSLDVSKNTALTYLSFYSLDNLTTIDLSNNTALTFVCCSFNNLTSLNVSNNIAIKTLICNYNNLNNLNVINNTTLTYLDCRGNNLSTLNVSNNTDLDTLLCAFNTLKTLDLSNNIVLTYLSCESNSLTNLNVKNGNNINLLWFETDNNLDLQCIQVDDAIWAQSNLTYIDSWTSFSEDCILGINNQFLNTDFEISPNPFYNVIELKFPKTGTYELRIINLLGEIVFSTTISNIKSTISTSNLPSSVYLIQVKSEDGLMIKKILKQ